MKLTINFDHNVMLAYSKLYEEHGGDARIEPSTPIGQVLLAIRAALHEADKPAPPIDKKWLADIQRGTLSQ